MNTLNELDKNSYTFKDLFIKLDKELKLEYPDNFNIQDLDINYLIDKQGFSVVDIFSNLDMLQWEREKGYKWCDVVLNEVNEDILNDMIESFKIDMLA